MGDERLENIETLEDYVRSSTRDVYIFLSSVPLNNAVISTYLVYEKPPINQIGGYLYLRPIREGNPDDESFDPVHVPLKDHLEDRALRKVNISNR